MYNLLRYIVLHVIINIHSKETKDEGKRNKLNDIFEHILEVSSTVVSARSEHTRLYMAKT